AGRAAHRPPDAQEPRSDRVLADAPPRPTRDDRRAARRALRARGARRPAAAAGHGLPAQRRAARARGPPVAPHDRQARAGPVLLGSGPVTTFRELGLSEP